MTHSPHQDSQATFQAHKFLWLLLALLWAGGLTARAQTAGVVDGSFVPNVNNIITTAVLQPDGKMIIAGVFSLAGGAAHPSCARLNAGGTVDTNFNGSTNGVVRCAVLQADGKVVIAGDFTSVNGSAVSAATGVNRIARLNADGTRDTAFNASGGVGLGGMNDEVLGMARQNDGRLVVVGLFTSVNGSAVNATTGINRIVRLNADGSLHTVFNTSGGANNAVSAVAVQPDGKLVVGGDFTSVGGSVVNATTGVNRIARLNTNGTRDATFNATGGVGLGGANNTVFSIVPQPDGKLLIAGVFSSVNGSTISPTTGVNRIARLNADGTRDTAFNATGGAGLGGVDNSINSMALQTDGKIVIGGYFTSVNGSAMNAATGVNRIARLNADGTRDTAFASGLGGANNTVFSVGGQADGKLLIGGSFLTVNGSARTRAAQLNNDLATQIMTSLGCTDLLWTRSGAEPDVSQVTFDVSFDGGITWAGPFGATRVGITPNWLLTGFNFTLSSSIVVRARGRVGCGIFNGSSGIIEQVTTINFPEMAVKGNNTVILDGDTTPGLTDDTDFGSTPLNGGSVVKTFTIVNTGPGVLDLTGSPKVSIGGSHAADFPILTQPTTPVAANTGTVTFQITFNPSAVGIRTATVSIDSNDCNENPYNFTIQGNGLPPPTVALSTVSILASGTSLTITGTNFDATTPGNNSVVFSPTGSGVVTASTGTTLTISNITGLSLGPLYAIVTTNGQSSGVPVQVATVVSSVAGELCPTFNDPLVGGFNWVLGEAVLPAGGMIIVGDFPTVGAVAHLNIAKLLPSGSVDPTYTAGANSQVHCAVLQPDGKLLIGGSFTSVNGSTLDALTGVNRLARLDANGVLDPSFSGRTNGLVRTVVLQPDGKLLIGGEFTKVNNNPVDRIARLNANGTTDTSFFAPANDRVFTLALQSDGRIWVGGDYTILNGSFVNRISRLTPNGALDPAFNNSLGGADEVVNTIALQADGLAVVGGLFFHIGGGSAKCIVRLSPNGALDPAFNVSLGGADDPVVSIGVQTDGRLVIGGSFGAVNGSALSWTTGVNRIARLNADGTRDMGFNSSGGVGLGGAIYEVWSVALQASGKIDIGGEIDHVNGVPRNLFATLTNDPATQVLTAPSNAQLLWTRSGAGPELSQVTFERSTNNGTTWTALGNGTRIGTTPNWQLTGLSLAGTSQIRARGRTSAGFTNGSSGIIEQSGAFTFPGPEIVVKGNNTVINDEDVIPSLADHTDFGCVAMGGNVKRTFAIANIGNANLNLTGSPLVAITGTNGADFILSVLPSTPIAGPSGSATFEITFTPSAAGLRTATLSIANNDSDENPYNFSIQGTGYINSAPDFVCTPPPAVVACSGPATVLNFISAISPGPSCDIGQGVTVSIDSFTNPGLFALGGGPTLTGGTLSYTPGNAAGTSIVTIKAVDNGGTANGGMDTTFHTCTITVLAANPPTISNMSDLAISEDTGTGPINFTVGDIDPNTTLTVTAASSDTTLLPNSGIVLGGAAGNRTITLTPAADQCGTVTVTVTVSDQCVSVSDTLILTVNQINDAPSFVCTTPPSVVACSGAVSVPNFITGISPGPGCEAGQTAPTISITNITNPGLFAFGGQPTLASGTLSYTPGSVAGTSVITITAVDNGGTANGGADTTFHTCTITVLADTAPTISNILDLSINEDSATGAISFTIGDIDTGAAGLAVTATSSNTTLLPPTGIVLGGTAGNRTITLTPVADECGTATVTVTVGDGCKTASDTFVLTVISVNDAPSFVCNTPPSVVACSGATSVPNFITGISPGPGCEAGQTAPTISITNITNPSLFAAGGQPALSSGALSYTPGNVAGTSVITITAVDNGGTANGGVKTAIHACTITVTGATNTPPSFSLPICQPGLGTWAPQASNRIWSSIACSADGSKVAATVTGGQIHTSVDFGYSWTPRATNRKWKSIASSADGLKLAAVENGGLIYYSSDAGLTWAPRDAARNWWAITSSASGSKLAAVVNGGQIYVSTNGGASWLPYETNRNWWSITYSADGSTLVAVENGGLIYKSINDGVIWQAQSVPALNWTSIASSSNGSQLVAVAQQGQIYISNNGGSWLPRETARNWTSIASSADGSKLAAVVYAGAAGKIFLSCDSGATWASEETARKWVSIASSADGNKLAAAVDTGKIYTSCRAIVPIRVACSGPASITPFVTNISPGPDCDPGQTVSFTVTNDNHPLFLTQPAISPTGTLTFTPSNVVGIANVTVSAVDSGGTANGGSNNSGSQTFTIFIAPTTDADLTALTSTAGPLSFLPNIIGYDRSVPNGTTSITVTPTSLPGRTIEVRSNGGAWTTVVSATATAPIPLNLGTNAIEIRVTYQNCTKTYTLNVLRCDLLENWRMLHFGNASNTGNGATTADPDNDGVVNLTEYAFGLDPLNGASLQTPQPVQSGQALVIQFTQPAAVGCIIYGAEWTPNPSTGPWTPVPDTGTGNFHKFSIPVSQNQSKFMRLVITTL